MKKPKKLKYYKPQEKPTMYPLELTTDHHICLWSNDGNFKWTIALFEFDKEGPSLRFIGDRPLESEINWHNLEVVIRQGQLLAEQAWIERDKV